MVIKTEDINVKISEDQAENLIEAAEAQRNGYIDYKSVSVWDSDDYFLFVYVGFEDYTGPNDLYDPTLWTEQFAEKVEKISGINLYENSFQHDEIWDGYEWVFYVEVI